MSANQETSNVALVTGAAGGIGRAICRALSSLGYHVIGADRAEAWGDRDADGKEPSWHTSKVLDVTSMGSWEKAVREIKSDAGRLDALVNNAGVLTMGDLESTSLEAWSHAIAVNLTGAFIGMKTCAPMLRSVKGSVVNVSSIVGLKGNDRMVAYAASKAGLLGLTYAVAKDFAPSGVRVNAVCPGTIDTKMSLSFFADSSDRSSALKSSIAKHPLGRLGLAADVASAVAYLVSEQAAFVTGIALPVDGGRSLG